MTNILYLVVEPVAGTVGNPFPEASGHDRLHLVRRPVAADRPGALARSAVVYRHVPAVDKSLLRAFTVHLISRMRMTFR
jgi:hypothetical protein